MDSNNPNFYVERSDLYLFINELDNCIFDLQKALEKDPKNPYINYKLGLGYYLQSKFDNSIYYLEQSIAHKPKDDDKADTFYHLGLSQN